MEGISVSSITKDYRESMSSSELDEFFRNKWKAPREFYHMTPRKQEEVIHNLKAKFVTTHKIVLIQDERKSPQFASVSVSKPAPSHVRTVCCSFCGRQPGHTCSSLFPCSRNCGVADYCSKLCEKSHRMQGHRPFCGSKPAHDHNNLRKSTGSAIEHSDDDCSESEDEFDDWLVKPKNLNKSNGDGNFEIPDYPFPIEDNSNDVSESARSGLLEPLEPNSPWLKRSNEKQSNESQQTPSFASSSNSTQSSSMDSRALYRTQSQHISRSTFSDKRDWMALPNSRRLTRTMSYSEGRLPLNAFLVPAEPIEPTVEMAEPTNSRKLA